MSGPFSPFFRILQSGSAHPAVVNLVKDFAVPNSSALDVAHAVTQEINSVAIEYKQPHSKTVDPDAPFQCISFLEAVEGYSGIAGLKDMAEAEDSFQQMKRRLAEKGLFRRGQNIDIFNMKVREDVGKEDDKVMVFGSLLRTPSKYSYPAAPYLRDDCYVYVKGELVSWFVADHSLPVDSQSDFCEVKGRFYKRKLRDIIMKGQTDPRIVNVSDS